MEKESGGGRRRQGSSKRKRPNKSLPTMKSNHHHHHHLNHNQLSPSKYSNQEQKQKLLDTAKLRPPDGMDTSNEAEDLSIPGAPTKGRRTVDDFLNFCDVVLKYANYPNSFVQEEDKERIDIKVESPLNSVGESGQGSTHSSSSSVVSSNAGEVDNVRGPEPGDYDDSWSQITCWCGKPFAGRPMIECENCFVWLHLTCARVRKSNIPEHFKCSRCKPKARRKRHVSGNSDDSPGTSSNALGLTLTSPRKSHSLGLQSRISPASPSKTSTPTLHADFARSASLKSPTYFPSPVSSNGNSHSPSKTGGVKRLAKPRPRRPAIVSSTTNSFENPTLLPLRLTITTCQNPPPFS